MSKESSPSKSLPLNPSQYPTLPSSPVSVNSSEDGVHTNALTLYPSLAFLLSGFLPLLFHQGSQPAYSIPRGPCHFQNDSPHHHRSPPPLSQPLLTTTRVSPPSSPPAFTLHTHLQPTPLIFTPPYYYTPYTPSPHPNHLLSTTPSSPLISPFPPPHPPHFSFAHYTCRSPPHPSFLHPSPHPHSPHAILQPRLTTPPLSLAWAGSQRLTNRSFSSKKTLAVLSKDPEARRRPSQLQATECTLALCAGNSRVLLWPRNSSCIPST